MTASLWRRGEDWISTDRSHLDFQTVAELLGQSYWAAERPMDVIRRSCEQSLCFGVYRGDRQIGFCRVVTDHATFGWVADVIITPDCRGQGIGSWLMATVAAHPELQGFRRWLLATRDAHDLYSRVGFQPLARPEMFMERLVDYSL